MRFVKWSMTQPVEPDVSRARGFEPRIHHFCRGFDFALNQKIENKKQTCSRSRVLGVKKRTEIRLSRGCPPEALPAPAPWHTPVALHRQGRQVRQARGCWEGAQGLPDLLSARGQGAAQPHDQDQPMIRLLMTRRNCMQCALRASLKLPSPLSVD